MAPKKASKSAKEPPPPPVEEPAPVEAAEEEEPPEEPPPPEEPEEPVPPPRDYVGWVFEDVFKDLYVPPIQPKASETPVDGGASNAGSVAAGEGAPNTDGNPDVAQEDPGRPKQAEVDTLAEDAEIRDIHYNLEQEHERLNDMVKHLEEKKSLGAQMDREDDEYLQNEWGLAREHIPVGDSKLRTLLEKDTLERDRLILPRDMVAGLERRIEFSTGTLQQHDNLLASSKPKEPNHYMATASTSIRLQTRKIQPRLDPMQRTALAEELQERQRKRPQVPADLSAEERERNREVIKRMEMKVSFLKNPRYQTDRSAAAKGEACPFWFSPQPVLFRSYEVGKIYERVVEFRNVTKVGRRLRVLPPASSSFSLTPLDYKNSAGQVSSNKALSAVVAPGMAAQLVVRFAPRTLNDERGKLSIATEFGDYPLEVIAQRVQPKLEFKEPTDCGCILAGNKSTNVARLTNRGGEGSFRLVPSPGHDDGADYHYITGKNGYTCFMYPPFSISPANFYLEAGQSVDLTVIFSATVLGEHKCCLNVECDNGDKIPLTLVGITDAVRLELVSWPTRPEPVVPCSPPPGTSPWSLVPWRLDWLSPGTQVGCSSEQAITISNGGYLPATVVWRLIAPPRPSLLSRLAVGGQQRLTGEILADVLNWPEYKMGTHGSGECPFTVSPASASIAPFTTETFTFSFHAHAPVGQRKTAFAYLAATSLPASGHCLLDHGRLLELQGTMQPAEYKKGFPLFGGSVGAMFDRRPDASAAGGGDMTAETASSVVTAVCMQGIGVAPAVACLPRVLAFSGDILPFIAHTREIKLRNTGPMRAHFRVRLSSAAASAPPDSYDPLWVVSTLEVGPRPPPACTEPDADSAGMGQESCVAAERLANQWPPLPPQDRASQSLPGYGAFATAAVEPHEGHIPPGGSVTMCVTFRVLREMDVSTHLMIDFPVQLDDDRAAAPPLKVGIVAAVRAPRMELRHMSYLDYGVVRAHARHELSVRIDNPTDLPMLVRLKPHKEGKEEESKDAGGAAPRPTPFQRSGQVPLASSRPASAGYPSGMSKLAVAAPGDLDNSFPLDSHEDIVKMFLQSVGRGSVGGFAAVLEEDAQEAEVEPWVHSRSGCLEKSGRKKYVFQGRRNNSSVEATGEDNTEDFSFQPSCVAVWPHQSADVGVTLRTGEVGKYRGIVKAVAFDSTHFQCIDVMAEVQLPQLRLSTQHVHFPISYLRTATCAYELQLRNDSDMPATFHWDNPVKLEESLQVQLEPKEGMVPPHGVVSVSLVAVPIREVELAVIPCHVFIDEVLQPLQLKVSAKVFGPEVDYAIVPMGETPPQIKHEPRMPGDESCMTCPVKTGRAPPESPIIDFGEMELQKSKAMHIVLYNRTGIATGFAAKIEHNPAYDPLTKGRKIGDLFDAATRMYQLTQVNTKQEAPDATKLEFSSQPQPAAKGRQLNDDRFASKVSRATSKSSTSKVFDPKARRSTGGASKSAGKRRKFLLDDKHEKQAFRSNIGVEFAKQKEYREAGSMALKAGHGWAVKVEPGSDWLQPFGMSVVTLTCFSDLPGLMEDELVINVAQLREHGEGGAFRIPVRLLSHGNPLYLPEQQVGLNLSFDPPRLLCGTITPAEKQTSRHFKIANNSSAKVRIVWNVFRKKPPKPRVEPLKEEERPTTPSEELEPGGEATTEEQGEGVEHEEQHHKAKGDGEAVADMPAEEQKSDAQDPADVTDSTALLRSGEGEGGDEEGAGGEAPGTPEPPEETQPEVLESPDGEDPFLLPTGELPVRIEPQEAVIPVHGTTTFIVHMVASKSTTSANGHYRYHLVGKGRFAEGRYVAPSVGSASSKTSRPHKDVATPGSGALVASLPQQPFEDGELHDSDSDAEPRVPSRLDAIEVASDEKTVANPSSDAPQAEPQQGGTPEPLGDAVDDVLSTIVVDCLGDCILPRLSVDKKADPAIEDYGPKDAEDSVVGGGGLLYCPVFKFIHSAVLGPYANASERTVGLVHGSAANSVQISGVASCLVRHVTLSNHNACNISCRFRTERPFRIRQIEQVGHHPIKLPSEKATIKKGGFELTKAAAEAFKQTFTIATRETITLQMEFLPDAVPPSDWAETQTEHTSDGDLIVEYPRDLSDPPRGAVSAEPADLQRIHLLALSRRPTVRVHLVPKLELDQPASASAGGAVPEVVVEFGRVHVHSGITHRRAVLISNTTAVPAKWQLVHVGAKRRNSADGGGGDSDADATDSRDVFDFDACEGYLLGPSKDGLVHGGTGERQPHWCPPPSRMCREPHPDEQQYEPQRVVVSFKPMKNELYKCRFRIQVEAGISVDFVCRGHGSYDEKDDAIDGAQQDDIHETSSSHTQNS